MRSGRLAVLLDQSTADHTTVSLIKPVLHVSGDPSVVIDHRYIYSLKVMQLKDILQALRDLHGPSVSYSTTGNKDVLIQRVLMALYPQHASVIVEECGLPNHAQPAFRPSNSLPGQAPPMPGQQPPGQQYPASSFAAIPHTTSTPYAMSGSFLSGPHQPSTSPRVQVHLRAPTTTAPSSAGNIRVPVVPQQSAVSSYLKDAVARWSHPMFEKLASETFVFTHPVTNLQAALPFDKPQPGNAVERILIVPFTRRGTGSSICFVPYQLQPGPSVSSVSVSWNNFPVEVPKFVAVKTKLASAAIHYHPMFVPPNAPFFKIGSNRLVMTGGGSENVSGVAIMLVRPRQVADLEALVRSHPMSKITKRPEFHQDDDCAATFTPVQLKDPLSFCRIQVPVKTVRCKHLQCFDLATFIQFCERNGIWYCPCCPSKPALSIDDVYVDEFFLNMIKDASAHDTNTVYLLPDGSWTTTDPNTLPTPAPAPARTPALSLQSLPPPAQPLVQRIRVFPDGIPSGNAWPFELPVGSTVKSLKAAIEARYQLPQELFCLRWHESKVKWVPQPAATLDSSSSCTARPTIVIDLNEVPVQDDSPVLVFGQGEPQELALQTQELALQNEALYSMKWLIHRKHARAFFSFRLSPAQADLLCGILNMLVDDLNSNDNGDWQKNAKSRLDECDIKLLATFAPSSQQDMQALLPHKSLEFWNSYHQIFLKSVVDFHQLGRNRLAASVPDIQHRNAHISNGLDVAGHADAVQVVDSRIQSHAHASASPHPSSSHSYSSLLLSRAIGEQDAADRLRAAAEWLDSPSHLQDAADRLIDIPSHLLCSVDDDGPATSGRRSSLTDDDLPMVVQPPQIFRSVVPDLRDHLPRSLDSRPPVSYPTPRLPTSSQPAGVESRRHTGQPSIGQKRPAVNSTGSSASNAIIIDDD